MRVLREELRRALFSGRFFVALAVGIVIAVAHVVLFVVPESQNQEMYIELVQHPMTAYGRWMGGWAETMFPFLFFYLLPLLCCLPFSDSFWSDAKSGWDRQVVARSSRSVYLLSKAAACSVAAIVIALVPLALNLYLTALFLPIFQPEPSASIYPIASYHMWSDIFYTNVLAYCGLYGLLIAVTASLLACLPLALTYFVKNGFVLTCSSFFLCTVLQYFFTGDLLGTEALVFLSPVTFMQPYQPFHSGIGFGHIAVTLVLLLVFEVWCFWRRTRSRDMV